MQRSPFELQKSNTTTFAICYSTGTCQNPLAKSNLIKYLVPARDSITSSIKRNGYFMGMVKSLTTLRSTQNLSVSPLLGLGTTTTELYHSSSLHSTTLRVNNLFTVSSINSYLVAPHVEGRHGVLFMTDCLLLVGKTSPSCLGLSICISGEFV